MDAKLASISAIRDDVQDIFARYGESTSEVTPTLKRLFHYLSTRSQAVSYLLSAGYAWDSEIILRSFYDTAAKILLISFTPKDEQSALIGEYWNDLGAIYNRKRARRAELASRFPEKDSDLLTDSIFQALSDRALYDMADGVSKAKRKALEQKWSFDGIIKQLQTLGEKGKPLIGADVLLHMYGMASHLIHADAAAMDLIDDRKLREPNERALLEASHASRIMSDQVCLWWFCAYAVCRHYNGRFKDEKTFFAIFSKFDELSKPIQKAFHESQREFYSNLDLRKS